MSCLTPGCQTYQDPDVRQLFFEAKISGTVNKTKESTYKNSFGKPQTHPSL